VSPCVLGPSLGYTKCLQRSRRQIKLSCPPSLRLPCRTCLGEDHREPIHGDGTFAGKFTPEIGVFEATIPRDKGAVSQSCQLVSLNASCQRRKIFIASNPTITERRRRNSPAWGSIFLSRVRSGGRTSCVSFQFIPGSISAVSATSGSPEPDIFWSADNVIYRRRGFSGCRYAVHGAMHNPKFVDSGAVHTVSPTFRVVGPIGGRELSTDTMFSVSRRISSRSILTRVLESHLPMTG